MPATCGRQRLLVRSQSLFQLGDAALQELFRLPQILYATLDGIGAGGVALRPSPLGDPLDGRRNCGIRTMQGRADREDERGGNRQPDVLLAHGRDRDRPIVHAAFLAQPSRDLQPDVIGRLRIAERFGGIADPPQVALERAARVAPVQMLLELGGADRSQRAVEQRVNVFGRSRAVHGHWCQRDSSVRSRMRAL